MKDKLGKIKVVMTAPSIRALGGQSIQAQRLLNAFSDSEKIEINFIPNNPETRFQHIKFLRTFSTSVKFWWQLLIKLVKADIVHIFSSGTTSYIISSLPPLFVAKLFGKKTILNYHTGEAEQHLREWRWTAKPTMKWFDKILVPSQFLVDIFAEFDLQADAICNFVDFEKFRFKERKVLRPIFLSNRNFEEYYNVSSTIRAFSEIQKEFPEANMIIAGYGSEEQKLKDLVKKLNLENVEFVGKVPNEEMPKLYDSADIYLNSSTVDNMPLSIIEAFSAGIPVISSNAGGIPYILNNGKTGILVEMNDHLAMAKAAIKLLNNNHLAQSLIYEAKLECEKYTWGKVKNAWTEYYQIL